MALTSKQAERPYNFDAAFERAIVVLACSRPKFFGRIGREISASLLTNPEAKIALEAAQAIGAQLGHGPSSLVVVMQRLRRMVDAGKYTFEQLQAVNDLFDAAEDSGLPAEDDVINELVPVLQERIRREAVIVSMDDMRVHGDLRNVVALEEKAQRLGQVDTSIGTILGSGSFDEMLKLRELQRLKTGIVALDGALDGGLQRSGLGIAIAATGGGKSMFLSQQSAVTLCERTTVAYATLELPKPVILARVKAAITGIPINTLLHEATEEAQARIEGMMADGKLGSFIVHEFAPMATQVEDIKSWVDKVEDQMGKKVDLLVVDYGDKLGAKSKKGDDAGSYQTGLHVFEALRYLAVEKKCFCWTASQATRMKDKKKNNRHLDCDDVADSMHKVRVADLVISLNEDQELHEMTVKVGKHRTGPSGAAIGPFPTFYEIGRIGPIQPLGGSDDAEI